MSINYTVLATSAFGFALALSWNDAISKTFKSFYPPHSEKEAARQTIIYALIITLIIIFIVIVTNHARKIIHKYTGKILPEEEFNTTANSFQKQPIVKLWHPQLTEKKPAVNLWSTEKNPLFRS